MYYWDSYELKRLSALNDADLKAEISKKLKLVFMKDPDGVFRAGDGKAEPAQDPNSISSTVTDVLTSAPPISPRYQSGSASEAEGGEHPHNDLFSDKMFIILVVCIVVGLLAILILFWGIIEEFLSGLSNVMGLFVLILLFIGLSIYASD